MLLKIQSPCKEEDTEKVGARIPIPFQQEKFHLNFFYKLEFFGDFLKIPLLKSKFETIIPHQVASPYLF